MNIKTEYFFNFENYNNTYYSLLIEEDFNFKNKNILVSIDKLERGFKIQIVTTNLLNLKIASNAVMKSLEIIEKTLNI